MVCDVDSILRFGWWSRSPSVNKVQVYIFRLVSQPEIKILEARTPKVSVEKNIGWQCLWCNLLFMSVLCLGRAISDCFRH
jgi:hypothetical protein